MDFQDIIDYCQAEALAEKLGPTNNGVYRHFCRTYCKMFYTPLHIVYGLPVAEVVLSVFENQVEEMNPDDNMESIMDMIYTIEDPDYAKEKQDDLKRFIRDAEEEEEERQRLGKPIHKAMAGEVSIKNSIPAEAPLPNKKMPTGGSINLSYLDKEESGGFDEES